MRVPHPGMYRCRVGFAGFFGLLHTWPFFLERFRFSVFLPFLVRFIMRTSSYDVLGELGSPVI